MRSVRLPRWWLLKRWEPTASAERLPNITNTCPFLSLRMTRNEYGWELNSISKGSSTSSFDSILMLVALQDKHTLNGINDAVASIVRSCYMSIQDLC
jgi:hypothetical protein